MYELTPRTETFLPVQSNVFDQGIFMNLNVLLPQIDLPPEIMEAANILYPQDESGNSQEKFLHRGVVGICHHLATHFVVENRSTPDTLDAAYSGHPNIWNKIINATQYPFLNDISKKMIQTLYPASIIYLHENTALQSTENYGASVFGIVLDPFTPTFESWSATRSKKQPSLFTDAKAAAVAEVGLVTPSNVNENRKKYR